MIKEDIRSRNHFYYWIFESSLISEIFFPADVGQDLDNNHKYQNIQKQLYS